MAIEVASDSISFFLYVFDESKPVIVSYSQKMKEIFTEKAMGALHSSELGIYGFLYGLRFGYELRGMPLILEILSQEQQAYNEVSGFEGNFYRLAKLATTETELMAMRYLFETLPVPHLNFLTEIRTEILQKKDTHLLRAFIKICTDVMDKIIKEGVASKMSATQYHRFHKLSKDMVDPKKYPAFHKLKLTKKQHVLGEQCDDREWIRLCGEMCQK